MEPYSCGIAKIVERPFALRGLSRHGARRLASSASKEHK
jgi:hypothetical protein